MFLLAAFLVLSSSPSVAGPSHLRLSSDGRPVDATLTSDEEGGGPLPLAVILPGWGLNPASYTVLADALAHKGYVAAALGIARLDGDPPFVNKGDGVTRSRRPLWEIGVAAVDTLRSELVARGLADPRRPMVLIGHSHGGDIAVTYAERHPDRVRLVLALDHQRARVPTDGAVRFCLLRSRDLRPTLGFLPAPDAPSVLIATSDIPHADMRDTADAAGRAMMLLFLDRCLASASPTN